MIRRLAGFVVALGVWLPACSGDEEGDASDAADDSNPPTLSALQNDLFTPSCALGSSCHGDTALDSGLNLDAPVHGKIVGQASNAAASRTLVVAGDPDASYLIEKLSSEAPEVGERMPLDRDPLRSATIERVRAWIAAGALDD